MVQASADISVNAMIPASVAAIRTATWIRGKSHARTHQVSSL